MSKLVVSQFVTLDGVFQDPGGSGEFDRGGWTFQFSRGPEGDRFKFDEVMAAGGSSFEPMPGRPMTGYVMVPDAWSDDPKTLDSWIGRALAFGRTLPPKQKKSKNS